MRAGARAGTLKPWKENGFRGASIMLAYVFVFMYDLSMYQTVDNVGYNL